MKHICFVLCFLIVLSSTLSACTPSVNSGEFSQSSQPPQTTEPPHTETTQQPTEPDTASTPPTEVNTEPLFQFDKYLISPEAREFLSEREYDLYRKMVDALLDHSGTVNNFASEEEFHKIWSLLLMEFVPSRAMIQSYRQSETPYIYKDGSATLQFIADKEICDSNYAAFEEIINKALSLIQEDDSDWQRIAKLYLFVTEHMDYGSSHTEYGVEPNQYNSIVYELGICGNYADYLNMLANQIGFETVRGTSLSSNTAVDMSHAWSVIRVDGDWYHFDACWMEWNYFALSTQERYDSLLLLNTTGIPCELSMFSQNRYTGELRIALPYCERGISEEFRAELYQSVIKEYTEALYEILP